MRLAGKDRHIVASIARIGHTVRIDHTAHGDSLAAAVRTHSADHSHTDFATRVRTDQADYVLTEIFVNNVGHFGMKETAYWKEGVAAAGEEGRFVEYFHSLRVPRVANQLDSFALFEQLLVATVKALPE